MDNLNRRDFFKLFMPGRSRKSLFDDLGKIFEGELFKKQFPEYVLSRFKEEKTVCHNCPRECSFIVTVKSNYIVNVESDPDNPGNKNDYSGPECRAFLDNIEKVFFN